MTHAQKQDLLNLIEGLDTSTAHGKNRKENALKHFKNLENDDGAAGRIKEICNGKSKHSTANNFSKVGKSDCFIYVDGKRYNAEYKTNGGRIGSLYGKKAPKYVVYEMDVCNSGTNGQRRVIEPRVMRTQVFIQMLEECNAIKCTNGSNPEMAIQVTSKKLYLKLTAYELRYDCNGRYTETDF